MRSILISIDFPMDLLNLPLNFSTDHYPPSFVVFTRSGHFIFLTISSKIMQAPIKSLSAPKN